MIKIFVVFYSFFKVQVYVYKTKNSLKIIKLKITKLIQPKKTISFYKLFWLYYSVKQKFKKIFKLQKHTSFKMIKLKKKPVWKH